MGCVVFCSFLCIEVCVAESNVFVIFTLVVDDFVEKTFHLNGFIKREKEQANEDLKN